MNAKSQHKITDGRLMVGSCLQWYEDNTDISTVEMSIMVTILRRTFGFRRKHSFIPQNIFTKRMSESTLKRYRKKLVDAGIISIKPTKKMTLYTILEPSRIINNFIFTKQNNIEEEIKEEEVVTDW